MTPRLSTWTALLLPVLFLGGCVSLTVNVTFPEDTPRTATTQASQAQAVAATTGADRPPPPPWVRGADGAWIH